MNAEPETPAELAWYNQPRSFRFRACRWLSDITNGRILSPTAIGSLRYHRPLDADENAACRLSPDEHVEILGVWAIDVFTPANIERVLEAMRRRGWDTEFRRGSERNLVKWLRDARRVGGGSHNVELTRAEDRSITTIGHDADLPNFADFALGQIDCISPSITGMSIFFVTKVEMRAQFEDAIRRDYQTTVKLHGHAVSAITPSLARREAVRAIRREWRHEIAGWYRRYAPGHYATSGNDANLVTCEFLVGDRIPLFEERYEDEKPHKAATYLDAIFSPYTFDETELLSNEFKESGVTFATGSIHGNDLENHGILTVAKNTIEGTVDRLNEGAGVFRYAYGANDAFHATFKQWSILPLLSFYEERVNSSRDQATQVLSSGWHLGAMARLRRTAATLSDTALIARELSDLANSGHFAISQGYGLCRRKWRPREETRSIGSIIKESVIRRTKNLGVANSELHEHLSAQANLLSAAGNLWLQIVVTIFAILGLIFSGVSAFEAYRNLITE